MADLAKQIVEAAQNALDGSAFDDQPQATAVAVLRVLVEKHFPDEDVDYHYACEGLAQDACDVLRELEEATRG